MQQTLDAAAYADLQVSRKREAATREILEVISQSRDDGLPVFRMILKSALQLCEAAVAELFLVNVDRSAVDLVAVQSLTERPPQVESHRRPFTDTGSKLIEAVVTGSVVQIPDVTDTDRYRNGGPAYRRSFVGQRTTLLVPLLSKGIGIGALCLWRGEVRLFTPDEIALVETFAAQAVIAIENVRQFRELKDSLEQQQATSDILRVISQSREDEGPVFDLILQKAAVLCDADQGGLVIVNEARTHIRLMADWGHDRTAWQPGTEFSLDLPLPIMTTIRTAEVVHIEDYSQSDAYKDRDPIAVRMVETEGHRTRLIVPLVQNGIAIGGISLSRREVRPFTPYEIALVETFAAQAVIAIENVRQFRELQTRLAREAATREILEVISANRDDETPVFDAILRNAVRLCNSRLAGLNLGQRGDSHIRLAATVGWSAEAAAAYVTSPLPMDGDVSFIARSILDKELIHIPDMQRSELYLRGTGPALAIASVGVRAMLIVPLVLGDQAIGAISLHRLEAEPFTPAQIDLVQSFAAQAVIAIENVRQFRELQTRLAREAATREILEVISQSRDVVQPVYEAIMRNATRLCGASTAAVLLGRPDDPHLVMVGYLPPDAQSQDYIKAIIAENNNPPMRMNPTEHIAARAICSGQVVHIADLAQTESYRSGVPTFQLMVDDVGLRTIMSVPLFNAQGSIGALNLFRREVRPFDQDDIALAETFAAQAAIAIENVRQFKALEALNAELGDRVEAQVGEIERMGRLKRFLPAAVADAVVSSGSEKMLKSHRALLGVLFADIRGFTAFCETAEPEETIEVLQTYHEEMGRLIEAHHAGVDHRMGDGIMVLFNDPLPCDDPAGAAVGLAVAMRARMAELCAKWKKMGYRLGFGVGISLGYATVGMVGAGGRHDYTASGTAVNLAARLCDEAADGEILLSPRAAIAVEGVWSVESRGARSLKGIREPVEMFGVTGAAG